jgi:hypothetical protein
MPPVAMINHEDVSAFWIYNVDTTEQESGIHRGHHGHQFGAEAPCIPTDQGHIIAGGR